MLQLKCQQKYTMSSTYSYSKEIEQTLLSSVPGWIRSRCAMVKIIRSVCNLVKINPLETCLLGWLLGRSKYEIERISTDSRTRLVQEEFDQKVLLYILMNAYYVKNFLNETPSAELDNDIQKQVPNFKHLYSKKFNPEKSLKTLSLTDINRIFAEWTCRHNKRSKIDYNCLVDKILYLSKSYNVGGNQEGKSERLAVAGPRKRRKMGLVEEGQGKSEINSIGEKSQSMHFQPKNKSGSFKFTHSPQAPDFLGPSQQKMYSFKQEHIDLNMNLNQSKRTTRNMLQSINIYDMIPSQDNLFNSQFSNFSAGGGGGLMGSQHSRSSQNLDGGASGFMRKSRERSTGMRLRRTDSFDQIN